MFLYSTIVGEVFIIMIVLEAQRAPWKGAELQLERNEQVLKDKLFESISSYDGDSFSKDNSQAFGGTTTLLGLRKEEKVHASEKLAAL